MVIGEVRKMERHFTLEYWLDDDWYVGRIKEIPGVFSQGETLEELEDNILDAYSMVIESENEIDVTTDIKTKDLIIKV